MVGRTQILIVGTFTAVIAMSQIILCIVGYLQFFCYVDSMRFTKTFTFIKILYYNNPGCQPRIYLGPVINQMGAQAAVVTSVIPKTTTRTFVITSIYLPLGLLWVLSSVLLVMAASNRDLKIAERAFWMTITGITVIVDVVSACFYAGDIEFTKTLGELVNYIGAVLSGGGNFVVDTRAAAIFMMMFYLRFGVFCITNVVSLIYVLMEIGRRRAKFGFESGSARSVRSVRSVQSTVGSGSVRSGIRNGPLIPRASLLRRLPSWMSGRGRSNTFSYEDYVARNRPQRLRYLMAQRRRQLAESIIDTSMRRGTASCEVYVQPAASLEPAAVDVHPMPSTSQNEHAGTSSTRRPLLVGFVIPESSSDEELTPF